MTNRKQSRVTKWPFNRDGEGHARLTITGRASYAHVVRRNSQTLTIIVGLVVFLVLAGCSKGNAWENPGPKESFETFMMDLWRGNHIEVFEAIWPDDQKRLMAAAADLERDYPAIPKLKPEEWLVVGRVNNPYDIRRLDISSNAGSSYARGDRVMLEIRYFDERVGQAEMVWGGERWYVALGEQSVEGTIVEDVAASESDVEESDSGSDDGALQLLDEDVSNGND